MPAGRSPVETSDSASVPSQSNESDNVPTVLGNPDQWILGLEVCGAPLALLGAVFLVYTGQDSADLRQGCGLDVSLLLAAHEALSQEHEHDKHRLHR